MSCKLADFFRGDTKVYNLGFTKNGAALDITGATITFTLKANEDDADSAAKIQKTATIDDGPAGLASLLLTNTDTDIDPGAYWYDFQMKDASGYITTLTKNQLNVLADITRST